MTSVARSVIDYRYYMTPVGEAALRYEEELERLGFGLQPEPDKETPLSVSQTGPEIDRRICDSARELQMRRHAAQQSGITGLEQYR